MNETITLPVDKVALLLLNGQWYGSVAIPLDLAELLKPYDPTELKLEFDPCAKFAVLWTLEGWDSELKRRQYVENLTDHRQFDNITRKHVAQASPIQQHVVDEWRDQLSIALEKDNFKEADRLVKLIQRYERDQE